MQASKGDENGRKLLDQEEKLRELREIHRNKVIHMTNGYVWCLVRRVWTTNLSLCDDIVMSQIEV